MKAWGSVPNPSLRRGRPWFEKPDPKSCAAGKSELWVAPNAGERWKHILKIIDSNYRVYRAGTCGEKKRNKRTRQLVLEFT